MKKTGYFFFCFLPLLVTIGLQFAASVPVMGFHLLRICFLCISSGQKLSLQEFLMDFYYANSSQTSITMSSILYAVCGIILFGFWYFRQFHGDFHFPADRFLNLPMILGLVLLVPGLQMASSILTSVSASFFPGWMEFYEQIMESAGLTGGSPSLLLLLYAVLLGPVAEELAFRGVILSSAKKALPFWAANLFQALLFGIFHMNLIQGIYAFFIGLFLGYVCEKGCSIWLSVFLHILFNAWGTLAPSNLYSVFSIVFFIGLGIFGLFLFHKNTSGKSIKYMDDFSDI